MPMIQIIIFSFNRAMQLCTLLQSIKEKWVSPECKVDIIYNTGSDQYEKAYTQLKSEFPSYSFHKEGKFNGFGLSDLITASNLLKIVRSKHYRKPKSNFREVLNKVILESPANSIMFLTDDSTFISEVRLGNEIDNWINKEEGKRQFILRLGENYADIPSSIEGMEWDMSKYPFVSNWGYVFSVDAHIYSRKVVAKLLSKYIFSNPSTLEGYISYQARKNHIFIHAKATAHPFILSFPLNMVQEIANNESLGVSAEMLNKYYLEGWRLVYPIPERITSFQQYPDSITLCRGLERMVLNTASGNEI